MTADGNISNTGSGSSGGPTGNELLGDADGEVEKLFDVSCLPLTSIGGTANNITASFTPAETNILTGRRFAFVASGTNTGAVTINLNSMGAVPLRDDDGDILAAGQIVSGRLYAIYFDGTNYRLMGASAASVTRNLQTFTSSGTWTKPANVDAAALVIVECWGGGGGGGGATAGGGGGGGAYAKLLLRAGDLGSTVTVTIGAGGPIGSPGSNTTFGSHLTAYGGGAGSSSQGGGGGGGAVGAGSNGTSSGGAAVDVTSAAGGDSATVGDSSENGGGGGGGGESLGGTAGNGGNSKYGGGGGGGGSTGSADGIGGTSQKGGNGGNYGAGGTAPGGGGGGNAAGARGECRVHVIG